MLAQIDDVKQKMGLDPADTSNDGILELALSGAQTRILDRCGYSEEGETGHEQYIETIINGRTYLTELRPITNLLVVARTPMMDFAPMGDLAADVLNPKDGRVLIVGSSGWPWYRSTPGWEWTVSKWTYDVTPIAQVVSATELSSISDAISTYAAWLVTRAQSVGTTEQQIGIIRQALDSNTEPPAMWLPLAKHMRRTASRAEWV